MNDCRARRSIVLAGLALVVIVASLTAALLAPSAEATGLTLCAMVMLALSLHAIGRAHPGP